MKKKPKKSGMNNLSTKPKPINKNEPKLPVIQSLLGIMEDGKEYESIIKHIGRPMNVDLFSELRIAIADIQNIRNRPLMCYMSNVINQELNAQISIDDKDDLPFKEMIRSIPSAYREVDLLIVTPGGSGNQASKFVDQLRARFDSVNFIIPNIAMSAGTILAMSGDDIIMTGSSYIGPIDPQVPNREGRFVPAQSIKTVIEEIQKRGEEKIKKGQAPDWTDLEILRRIDPKEIGEAENASKFSEELVEKYLYNYKFKFWNQHSTTGQPVTSAEKQQRAKQIANDLCTHSLWKSHSRGITREDAWNQLRLKITHSESISGLDRALSRFWALIYFTFETQPTYKIFFSNNYSIMRNVVISTKP